MASKAPHTTVSTPSVTAEPNDYKSLWAKVHLYIEEDKPKSVIATLEEIINIAKADKSYGNLLSAELHRLKYNYEIEPDSLKPMTEAMQERADQTGESDPLLAAVYNALLGHIYYDKARVFDDFDGTKAKDAFDKALKDPDILYNAKSADFTPLTDGSNIREYSNSTMLGIIAHEANRNKMLINYYDSIGDRRGACLETYFWLTKARDQDDDIESEGKINILRKAMEKYGDLEECSLIAELLFNAMNSDEDYSAETKMRFIDSAIARWGESKLYGKNLKNCRNSLINPKYNIDCGTLSPILPNREIKIFAHDIRNISAIGITLTRLKTGGNKRYDTYSEKGRNEISEQKENVPVFTDMRAFVGHNPWEEFNDTITLPALKPGVYVLETKSKTVTGNDCETCDILYVSDIKLLLMKMGKEDNSPTRILTVSATTGQPLKGVNVDVFEEDYYEKVKNKLSFTSDNSGKILVTEDLDDYRKLIYAYTDNDKAFRKESIHPSYTNYDNKPTRDDITIFTDRSIYRPGQVVHVSITSHNSMDRDNVHAVAGKAVTVKMQDANNKEFFSEVITTDENGNASTDITLPTDRLNGTFSLKATANNSFFAYASVRVEDYKRPTFEVIAPEVKGEYCALDSTKRDINGGYRTVDLKFNARTLTQLPLSGADVTYSIKRLYRWWWCWWRQPNNTVKVLEPNVKTKTDADGNITIPVTLKVPQQGDGRYTFIVDVKVTNHSGETHSQSIFFNVKSSDNVPAEEEEAPKKPEEREVYFNLSASDFPRNEQEGVTFSMGSTLKNIKAYYVLTGNNGVIEEGTTDFGGNIVKRVFKYDSKYGDVLNINYVWVKDGKVHNYNHNIYRPKPDMKLKTEWKTFRDLTRPGTTEKWTLHITSTDKNRMPATLTATLFDKSLDNLAHHSFSFNPWNGHSSYIGTTWNQSKAHSIKSGTSSSFPYSYEEYPKDYGFDASYFPSYYNRLISPMKIRGNVAGLLMNVVMEERAEVMDEAVVAYGTMKKSAATAPKATADDDDDDEIDNESDMDASEESADLKGIVRSNFAETAFFKPALLSNADGDIDIEFTLPESVTTWRMLGFVHDRSMKFAMIDTTCVARKDVMIQPNMPRFLRQGDSAVVASSVTNMTEQACDATVILQILDPETEAVVMQKTKQIRLEGKAIESVSFPILTSEIGKKLTDLYLLRIAAKTSTGEDGEQHYLSILPATTMTTTTVPFTIHGKGALDIDIDKLFTANSTQRRVTLEYTGNAAWLMVQALPYISKPDSRNSISLATAIYSNTIASTIISTIPNFQNVLNEWKKDSVTLKSNLERNEELKELLLKQTPWVLEAEDESQQKEMLAEYFDLEKLESSLADYSSMLRSLQLSNGSWSWFEGMHGSPYLTAEIVEMLSRLKVLCGLKEQEEKMLKKALQYLGKEAQDEAKDLRKLQKRGYKDLHPSETVTTYIYASALTNAEMSKGVKKDVDYLISLMERVPREFTIYGKSRAAVIFARFGKKKAAKLMLESMEEYTVATEEAGRYYSTPRAYYSWRDYRIPTQVAAIEAFSILSPGEENMINEMKRWLLHEKRTQAWSTPINSVNAIYAFLMNTEKYAVKGITPSAKGGKKVQTAAEDGASEHSPLAMLSDDLDYRKETLDPATTHTLHIDSPTESTSWGAVYVQQLSPMDEIEATGAGITIKREIISPTDTPAVGDKVKVRITIDSERDYDFMVVTDNRAACLEPVDQLSGYHWGFYQEMRDCQTRYFIDRLPKGHHVIETDYYIDRDGDYLSGLCTAQCAYAPEFNARTSAQSISVKHKME